ncbi:hypothetical protein C808_02546 [Lachnospiraceae bacterium M18-1]|nr:hypothetical protein C808_02546 [Lachnospiraceae bacterium M18-1]
MESFYQYLPFEVDKVHYAVPMDYVAYIVSATDSYPYCIPPRRKVYIDCIMKIEQKLITVVELSAFSKHMLSDKESCQRPLILILGYQDSMLGVLADYIGPPVEFSKLNFEADVMGQHTFFNCGEEQSILFDVPQFYRELAMS